MRQAFWKRSDFWRKGVLLLALALFSAGKADALEMLDNKLEIHGYGHQGFLLTDGNHYLKADSKGTWEFNALALLFTVKATEDTTIWAQLFSSLHDFRLDWAFVNYQASNDLQLRAGQIKTPIGIYNEIRDVKYLQLSTLEPLIYQEELKLTHEAFRGASLVYDYYVGNSSITLDLYGGQQANLEEDEEKSDQKFNQLIGGRITYKTPINGLSLMGSGYTSKAEEIEAGETSKGRQSLWMGSVDYQNHGIDLKAEYASMKLIDRKTYGYYAQGGYTFFDKLTPFVRYDYLTTDKEQKSDPAFYQKDLVVGVGYKFNSNVALKVEDHFVRGYALPVVTGEIAPGSGASNWNLLAASINFIF
jgi:hypothetical protein